MGAVVAACLLATACGPGASRKDPAPSRPTDEAGYTAPPTVTSAEPVAGAVRLQGTAEPGARVRLATPTGQSVEVTASGAGRWELLAAAASPGSVYGLSQRISGRVTQAEGYFLVTPDGRCVQLRGGSGSKVIAGGPQQGPATFDIDREGGAVVSGRGPVNGAVSARIDGRKLGEDRIDSDGRFDIPLSGPAPPGVHGLKVFGESIDAAVQLDMSPAPPLTTGPFRITEEPAGLRVDWITPGGGVQTTHVLR